MRISRRRVGAVVQKEWMEFRQSKSILWAMSVLPIILVLGIIGLNATLAQHAGSSPDDLGEIDIPAALSGLSPLAVFLVQLNDQMLVTLLTIAVALPAYIAASSIISEKQTKTLEPLLATPTSTLELLLGKALGAISPAVITTWLAYGLILVGLSVVTIPTVAAYAYRPAWLAAMLLLCPLMALLSVLCGLCISSRVNDPRVAQQIMAFLLLPLIFLGTGTVGGWLYISLPLVLLGVLILAMVDSGLFWLTVWLFRREVILTRWR